MAAFIPKFLRQLRDVLISSPQDGDVLAYDAGSGKWGNSASAGGGASALVDLTDVTGTPGTGKAPVSDGAGGFPLTDVATQTELDAHTGAASGAHDASAIASTPAGDLAATDVQAALDELDTEKAPVVHEHAGEDITSGTVADARIALSIARDSEVTAAVAAEAAARDAAIAQAVTDLVGGAPGALDTLNELAAALGDDAAFATTVTNALATKIAKSLYDANSLLTADTDDTPAALVMGASTMLARLASGGIVAATPAQIRTLLSLVVGTDVEAHDADLTTIAGLSPSNNDVLQRKAGAWASRTIAQLLADLAAPGTTFQPLDATLTALAAANWTDFALSLLDDADAATARATLGVVASLFQDGGAQELSLAGLAGTPVELQAHLDDAADAHDASAISVADSGGNYAATDVEGVLAEIAPQLGGGTPAFSGARVLKTSNTTISDDTNTTLEFDLALFDTDGYYDGGNPSRLTAPEDGYYLIGANVEFEQDAGLKDRFVYIDINGGDDTIAAASSAEGASFDNTIVQVSTLYQLSEGDYIECKVLTESGNALDVLSGTAYSPVMWMQKVSSGPAGPTGPAGSGGFLKRTVYTSGSGNHAFDADADSAIVTCVGPGGGGGGADGGSSQAGVGGGGGSGGHCQKRYTGLAGQTVAYTVGSGGNGGNAGNNAGSAGSAATEFDTGAVLATKMSAKPGSGGSSVAAGTSSVTVQGGAGGAVATGGDINAGGNPGCIGQRTSGSAGFSGSGGPSMYGGAGVGQAVGSAVGNAATGYGAGGGGAVANSTTDRAGGAGAGGLIIVDEYYA